MNSTTRRTSFMRLMESRWGTWIIVAASALLQWLDYATGRDVRLLMLLVVPVAVAALTNHKFLSYALALVLPFTRVLFFIPWGEFENARIGVINAAVRAAVLVFVTLYSDQARKVHELRHQVEILSLRDRLKKLEGILPICSSCQRIRNEIGVYEPIDVFISSHSSAVCSHGICPECAIKLYPQQLKQIQAATNRERSDPSGS